MLVVMLVVVRERLVMLREWLVILAVAVAVSGCGELGGGSTLTVRPRLQWERSASGGTAQYRVPNLQLDARGTPATSPPVQTADAGKLSLDQVVAVRQIVADVASRRGLTPRGPTTQEQSAGWTEIYAAENSPARLRLRERDDGQTLDIEVREGATPTGSGALREELQEKLGLTSKDAAK